MAGICGRMSLLWVDLDVEGAGSTDGVRGRLGRGAVIDGTGEVESPVLRLLQVAAEILPDPLVLCMLCVCSCSGTNPHAAPSLQQKGKGRALSHHGDTASLNHLQKQAL